MRKYVAAGVMALAMCLTSCCMFNNVRHPEPRLTMAQHLERRTVAMNHWVGEVGKDEDGDPEYGEVDPAKDKEAELITYCSGVWISKDVFVTAHHCVIVHQPPIYKLFEALGVDVDDLETGGFKSWSPVGDVLQYSNYGDIRNERVRKIRTTHRAKVIAVDAKTDLAVLQAVVDDEEPSLPEHEYASIASEVSVGDDVHVVGHPQGLLWTYVKGTVAAVRDNYPSLKDAPCDAVQVSAPVWFGNSGGGAFNANGELIGVLSFLRKAPNVGFFVKFTEINALLDHNKIKR